jgi:hypothetical protein
MRAPTSPEDQGRRIVAKATKRKITKDLTLKKTSQAATKIKGGGNSGSQDRYYPTPNPTPNR